MAHQLLEIRTGTTARRLGVGMSGYRFKEPEAAPNTRKESLDAPGRRDVHCTLKNTTDLVIADNTSNFGRSIENAIQSSANP